MVKFEKIIIEEERLRKKEKNVLFLKINIQYYLANICFKYVYFTTRHMINDDILFRVELISFLNNSLRG